MDGFYLTLIAVVLAGIGARDQVLVAGLTATQGPRPAVLVVALLTAIATASFAAWAALTVAPLLAPAAQRFLIALALILAGLESIVIRPRPPPREPTLSLGALAVTVIAYQAIDAARFLVFAMALASKPQWLAGVAGAAGGIVLLTAGWMAPEMFTGPRVRMVRRVIGLLLLAIGIVIAAQVILAR